MSGLRTDYAALDESSNRQFIWLSLMRQEAMWMFRRVRRKNPHMALTLVTLPWEEPVQLNRRER